MRRVFVYLSALTLIPAALSACGDDGDSDGATGGTGGVAGMGGSAGSTGGSAGTAGTAGSAGQSFKVVIENVSGDSALPTPVSPGVYAVHQVADPIFVTGEADRGEGLEALAEDGDPAALVSSLSAKSGVMANAFDTPAGEASAGPAMPGQSYEFTFSAFPGDKLTLATMFAQSNDAFIANSGPGIELFDENGTPLAMRDVTADLALWDAGTEKDEAPGFGLSQAPRQPEADFGAAESTVAQRRDPTRTLPTPSAIVDVTVTESNGTYTVTLANVSVTKNVFMTPISPVFHALHDESWKLFEAGGTASAGLEALAESGDPSALVSETAGAAGLESGEAIGSAPVTPGDTLSFTVTPSGSAPRLSFATMIGQTNDVFIATPPQGILLMDSQGMPRPAADVEADLSQMLANWDAGTEANEAPGVGPNQAPRQSAPDQGEVDPNATIRLYADDTNDWSQALLSGFVTLSIQNAGGLAFDVTLSNVSGGSTFPGVISPVVWAIHDNSAQLFSVGMNASAGLEALAEDGMGTTLVSELMAAGGVKNAAVQGSAPAPDGLSFAFQVEADASHRFLSIASMAVPSNDTFLALGEQGIELVDAGGAARSDADIALDVAQLLAAYDAGTELNQAAARGPDMAGPGLQSGPNMGEAEGSGLVRSLATSTWPFPAASQVVKVTIEPM